MKKWKLLFESDRQSNNSSKNSRVKPQNNTFNQDSRNSNKAYLPLKRSKGENSFKHNKNVSSIQFKIPQFAHKYIKRSQTDKQSEKAKVRTEMSQLQGMQLGIQSLEDIQQKKTNEDGFNFTDRVNSLVLKNSNNQFNKRFQSQYQTERYFLKQPSSNTDVKQFNVQSPIGKINKNSQLLVKISKLKKGLSDLGIERAELKKSIAQQLKNYKQQLAEQKLNWIKFEKIYTKNQRSSCDLLDKIGEEYSHFREKIDQLEEQKQVFLQNLIKNVHN